MRRRFENRLIILGAGHLRDKLGELVSRLGLSKAVAFLGFRSNALTYFRQADVFLLSSCSEGFGNVIVEAPGRGTPVISTDCQHGPAEILDDGRYGLPSN
jgi:glycosyltransferase involved in cell wall biosynthesis